jgi:carotenoid 1,2-hydratase
MRMARPDFTIPVATNGYAWWYVDALSDDGRHGITVIAFIGSVFSPYYAWARSRAARTGKTVDPRNHVSINVAVYGGRGKRWAMTERGDRDLQRSRDCFQVADSQWRWENDGLTIDLNELGVPWPRRIRGQVRLTPDWLSNAAFPLSRDGAHVWHPFAPRARVVADFSQPALKWQGSGYLDGNHGSAPLQTAFRGWNWSRLTTPEATQITYDLDPWNAPPWSLTLRADHGGRLGPATDGGRMDLPRTGWRVRRTAPAGTVVTRSLEDTPFYARSEITGRLGAEHGHGVHESLDLQRLSQGWVNCLLPFRMPRRVNRQRRDP